VYVCVCKAVRERDIDRAVEDGAGHLRDLTRSLGVGTACGRCVRCARQCLDQALDARQREAQTAA